MDYEVKPRVGNWGGRICLPAAPHVQLSVSPGNALRITSFYPRQHSNAVRLSVTFLYCIKMAQHHHIYFLQPGSPIILVLPVLRLSDMRLGHARVFFLRGHRTAANTRAGSTQVHRSSGVPHSSDEVPPVRRVRRRRRHRLLPPPSRLSDVDE